MYTILADDNYIYNPKNDLQVLIDAKISLELNTTGTFTFTLPKNHPNISLIKKLTTVISVYDDNILLFEGRVIDTDTSFKGEVKHTCEGTLAYLLDSIQRPTEYHNLTPRIYLQDKLDQHNSQVEDSKKIYLGNVEIETINYSARADNQYTNTLETIKEKLIDSNGGIIRVRNEDGKRYLDYLVSYGTTSNQIIRFGDNMLDLTEYINAADIITILIPLGKADEETEKKLTIESVNDGKDYLENLEAISTYGRISGKYEWEDVTLPENLKTKGIEYLQNAANLSLTIELSTVDLHMIDVNIDRISLGDELRIISKPHSIDRFMVVSKREYDLLNPSNDKITLGETLTALTDKQLEVQKQANKHANIVDTVNTISGEVTKVQGNVSELGTKVVQIEEGQSTIEENTTVLIDKVNTLETKSKLYEKEFTEYKTNMDAQLKAIDERLKVLEKEGK